MLIRPTKRWTTLRTHPIQYAYYFSPSRFNVVPAGRRSGKTEIAKRRLIKKAITRAIRGNGKFHNGQFGFAAPTREQAKRIYWADAKSMIPKDLIDGKPKETELIIPLKNNVEIHIMGLDKPERIEGSPWDWLVLDEYGNMREEAWTHHIRAALGDRLGGCDFIGVPEGRNHYWDRYNEALECMRNAGIDDITKAMQQPGFIAPEWSAFHWKSIDILPSAEVESARRSLDELTFLQEYEGSFVNFTGQAYYCYSVETHKRPLEYNPLAPLIFCFDFNVSPGVAAVCQEQVIPGQFVYDVDRGSRTPVYGTGVIGEVWIPNNSTTPAVCRKLIADWGNHQGSIICYGDATGGSRGSAKVSGSDWDLIANVLGSHFGERLDIRVPRSNPSERVRVNAVNSRLKTFDGVIRMLVDGEKAPHVAADFEGVRVLEGGSGELDKKRDPKLTHISDAVGYYVVYEYPVREETMREITLGGLY